MMSTCCSKHVEAYNKYIKKEFIKLVITQNRIKMHSQQNIKIEQDHCCVYNFFCLLPFLSLNWLCSRRDCIKYQKNCPKSQMHAAFWNFLFFWVLVCTVCMGYWASGHNLVQKYPKKHKCQTLWNYYVSGYFGYMDIPRELIIFLHGNFLKCTMTDTLTAVVL
jgi:hypothetical protein